MERNTFIDLLKRVSSHKYGNYSDILLSKSLGFYFLKKFIETPVDDLDIWNADVDSSNDRGIDYVYIDDTNDDVTKVYLLQCKYSENGDYNVGEGEVTKFLTNVAAFPDINGTVNEKLAQRMNELNIIKRREPERSVEKFPIYLNFGKFTGNADSQLRRSEVDIYDYDRFNSELLLDDRLPDLTIELKQAPIEYNANAMLGILRAEEFFNDASICSLIQNQLIFHFNVRGLMANKKNSIAEDIKNTVMSSPENFFIRNNGITVICEKIEKTGEHKYRLIKASIINGQQTVRALYSVWGKLTQEKMAKLFVVLKVVSIDPKMNIAEINTVAKATNKQNPIKESDLFANEAEQSLIEEKSQLLPAQTRFIYARKRSITYPENENVITRDEATLLLSLFSNQNPSDRIEGLYKYNYKQIFENVEPEHIVLTRMLRKKIEDQHALQDNNNPTRKNWSDFFYKRFKKYTVINFCLYLFSHLLRSKFNRNEKKDRLKLLADIFAKMKETDNFDIGSYFNSDFWLAYQRSAYRFIKEIYDDQNATSDVLRKEPKLEEFEKIYDDFVAEKAIEAQFEPKLLV